MLELEVCDQQSWSILQAKLESITSKDGVDAITWSTCNGEDRFVWAPQFIQIKQLMQHNSKFDLENHKLKYKPIKLQSLKAMDQPFQKS